MHPEENALAIINKVCAPFFNSSKRSPKSRWDHKLSSFSVSKAVLRLEIMDCVNAGIKVESDLCHASRTEEASRVDAAIRGFDAT